MPAPSMPTAVPDRRAAEATAGSGCISWRTATEVTPILGILYGFEKQLNTDLGQVIQTASIPSSSHAKTPLFSEASVAGEWTEGSVSIASYVNSSGGYVADASISTGSSLSLKPDGTFKQNWVAMMRSTVFHELFEGKWRIEDDELVLTHKQGVNRYSLVGSGSDPKAGRFLVLGTYPDTKAKVSFASPRGPFQTTWYKIK